MYPTAINPLKLSPLEYLLPHFFLFYYPNVVIRINANLIDNIYKTMLWSICNNVLSTPQKSRKQNQLVHLKNLWPFFVLYMVCEGKWQKGYVTIEVEVGVGDPK